MTEKHPKDRFDRIPPDLTRVGAHRAPRRSGRGLVAFAWAALATGLLVAAGVAALFVINGRVNLPFGGSTGTAAPTTASATPTPTIAPTVDPALAVTVLNGTTTSNLAGDAGDALTSAGWNVIATANASARDIETTRIYIQDEGARAAALGVEQTIPGATIEVTHDYADTGSDVTVVLGADYAAR